MMIQPKPEVKYRLKNRRVIDGVVLIKLMAYMIDSQRSLMELALNYCSMRETSRVRLGLYLKRKCREAKIEEEFYSAWIGAVLDECERLKVVSDKRYADILVRDYTSRGKGSRYIEQKLKEKGIAEEERKFVVDEDEEFARAAALAEKTLQQLIARKSRSKAKPQKSGTKKDSKKQSDEKYLLKQKVLQKLISAGFSFSLGKRVLESLVFL